MKSNIIATWIYCDLDGEESIYPQVGGKSSTKNFQAVYWQCVATFFASSIRHNPSARHVVFTNETRLPKIDGLDLAKFLGELCVEIHVLPLGHNTPKGYFGAWKNQFYVLDIINYINENMRFLSVLLVDSDCVIIKPLDNFFENLKINRCIYL